MGTNVNQEADSIRNLVREGYAAVARGERSGGSCCGPAGGCGTTQNESLARDVGYSDEELAHLPEGANLGLSCGNPGAIAELREGEVVLDLGSGAGFDAFVIAPKVGATGRVIGVDMTADMLAKARRNAATFAERTGLHNVEFRLGEIEHLPVADSSVDVVISNCVLNLSPDKPAVWREIARVLRPGGRVAISDLALLRPLPEDVRANVEALVGCVAGAVLVADSQRMAHEAGLINVILKTKDEYVRSMTNFQDPLYAEIARSLPAGTGPADYVTSLEVRARKPGVRAKSCC